MLQYRPVININPLYRPSLTDLCDVSRPGSVAVHQDKYNLKLLSTVLIYINISFRFCVRNSATHPVVYEGYQPATSIDKNFLSCSFVYFLIQSNSFLADPVVKCHMCEKC